jgi:hypothetical protein
LLANPPPPKQKRIYGKEKKAKRSEPEVKGEERQSFLRGKRLG